MEIFHLFTSFLIHEFLEHLREWISNEKNLGWIPLNRRFLVLLQHVLKTTKDQVQMRSMNNFYRGILFLNVDFCFSCYYLSEYSNVCLYWWFPINLFGNLIHLILLSYRSTNISGINSHSLDWMLELCSLPSIKLTEISFQTQLHLECATYWLQRSSQTNS